jgi:protein O-mannosyl-transferase
MRRDWHIMALLAAATLAVFWQVTRHEFVNYDDPAYVTHNPMVQAGLTWPGLKWAFASLHAEATYWHPLTWLSHMLDCQLYGLKPAGHHLTSLLLHTLNTLLLFVLLRRLTGRPAPSAVLAALFALHPLQVDSVAWIAERKNLLSASFALLSLWAYARYAEARKRSTQAGTRNCPTRFYALSLVSFALGLMSKPSLVPLPFLMLLLDYWPLRRLELKTLLPLLLEKLPLLALSLASGILTILGHQSLGALVSAAELPLSLRFENAVVACALYLRKLAWPFDLSVFYLHPGRWPSEAVAGAALLLLGLSALALWQARRRPWLIVGWLWFLGMLLPVLGLVQAHVQALADRFAYLPVIGVFLMLVWSAAELPAAQPAKLPRYALPGLATLALAACALITCFQLPHWRSSLTLLQRATQVEPRNFLARVMLGNALFERRQFDDALRHYQAALQLRPEYPDAALRAGVALTEQGQPADAMPYLLRAAQLAPAWPEPQRRLALALLRQGRLPEAREAYQKLIPLMPTTAEGCRDLADMLAEGQQFDQAVDYYRQALRLKPDFAEALNNLAMLRASCPQTEFRSGTEAVQLAETACRLSGRRNPASLGTLAAAYAEAGRFPEALKTIQDAITLSKTTGADHLLPIQTRALQDFRAGRPFR